MKPLAQRLRHRIDIEEQVTEFDSDGVRVDTWVSIRASEEALIPAEVMPVSGREFTAANGPQAGVTARITLRYRAGLDPAMRVLHDGDIYNIKAILPDSTGRKYLSLMAEAGVNEG